MKSMSEDKVKAFISSIIKSFKKDSIFVSKYLGFVEVFGARITGELHTNDC